MGKRIPGCKLAGNSKSFINHNGGLRGLYLETPSGENNLFNNIWDSMCPLDKDVTYLRYKNLKYRYVFSSYIFEIVFLIFILDLVFTYICSKNPFLVNLRVSLNTFMSTRVY